MNPNLLLDSNTAPPSSHRVGQVLIGGNFQWLNIKFSIDGKWTFQIPSSVKISVNIFENVSALSYSIKATTYEYPIKFCDLFLQQPTFDKTSA